MGDPLAKFLINRYRLTLTAEEVRDPQDMDLSEEQKKEGIGHLDFLDAVLAIHVCIIVWFFTERGRCFLTVLIRAPTEGMSTGGREKTVGGRWPACNNRRIPRLGVAGIAAGIKTRTWPPVGVR